TGPILLQREASIGQNDTAGSLYYQTLFSLGVEVCLEAVALVRAGDAPRIPQDEGLASYDPLLTDAHAAIDWTRPASALPALVRGCDPTPGAHTTWRRRPLRLFEPKRREDGAGAAAPGTVLDVGDPGLVVATGDGVVCCRRLRADAAKAPAAE